MIAPDYPGFGRSVAPWTYGFTIAEHVACLTEFIDGLDLDEIILVVQDCGGPIGLTWAVAHPESVKGLVLGNTLLQSPRLPLKLGCMTIGGPLGKYLMLKKNFFAAKIVPDSLQGTPSQDVLDAYTAPFPDEKSRIPTWVFPREIVQAEPLLDATLSRIGALRGIPVELLFGLKDPTFCVATLECFYALSDSL